MVQIEYLDIEEQKEYEKLIEKVIKQCYIEEKLQNTNLYIAITLTNPENIQKLNKEYRNIDKETDVLSFPMFEKDEIEKTISQKEHIVEDKSVYKSTTVSIAVFTISATIISITVNIKHKNSAFDKSKNMLTSITITAITNCFFILHSSWLLPLNGI